MFNMEYQSFNQSKITKYLNKIHVIGNKREKRMSNAGCWMLDAGCWMLDAGCWMLDAGCWMLDAGCWMLDAGCWMLDIKIGVYSIPS